MNNVMGIFIYQFARSPPEQALSFRIHKSNFTGLVQHKYTLSNIFNNILKKPFTFVMHVFTPYNYRISLSGFMCNNASISYGAEKTSGNNSPASLILESLCQLGTDSATGSKYICTPISDGQHIFRLMCFNNS